MVVVVAVGVIGVVGVVGVVVVVVVIVYCIRKNDEDDCLTFLLLSICFEFRSWS